MIKKYIGIKKHLEDNNQDNENRQLHVGVPEDHPVIHERIWGLVRLYLVFQP